MIIGKVSLMFSIRKSLFKRLNIFKNTRHLVFTKQMPQTLIKLKYNAQHKNKIIKNSFLIINLKHSHMFVMCT